jgi:N-acetylglucosaminyldiphosphoundecaprenol N-acetyl-beta-D-mannosaminyltransferase
LRQKSDSGQNAAPKSTNCPERASRETKRCPKRRKLSHKSISRDKSLPKKAQTVPQEHLAGQIAASKGTNCPTRASRGTKRCPKRRKLSHESISRDKTLPQKAQTVPQEHLARQNAAQKGANCPTRASRETKRYPKRSKLSRKSLIRDKTLPEKEQTVPKQPNRRNNNVAQTQSKPIQAPTKHDTRKSESYMQNQTASPNKENYLGVNVSPYSYEEIIADIKKRMSAGQQSTLIAVNPEKVIAAQQNAELRDLINSSTYQIPDGVGILLASKLKGGKINSRVTGVDMMDTLIRFAAEENHKVFLYGAKEEVVAEAKRKLEEKYPTLNISGYENGYIKDNNELIQKINDSQAELLFVAMGSPKQELWIRENMPKLQTVKVFQGVGGSFDVFAGHVQRAPEAFRKTGTEWLFRLAKEPKRFKRQLALPKFLAKILFSR